MHALGYALVEKGGQDNANLFFRTVNLTRRAPDVLDGVFGLGILRRHGLPLLLIFWIDCLTLRACSSLLYERYDDPKTLCPKICLCCPMSADVRHRPSQASCISLQARKQNKLLRSNESLRHNICWM